MYWAFGDRASLTRLFGNCASMVELLEDRVGVVGL